MGYRVHKSDSQYKVVEVVDGEVKDIVTNLTEEGAKAVSRSLNFGGGFDGRTPDFFLQKFTVSV